MVEETKNIWLREQTPMVVGTILWFWEQIYGKNNKKNVMNKYLRAKNIFTF
jgi:hypothetical protein